jgi:Ca2+-binding RTX toxin-like protein
MGNSDDDLIDGGAGNDLLKDAGGADTFLFKTAIGAGNVDKIIDFNAAADTIKLENTGAELFNDLAKGWLSADEFKVIGVGGSPVDANDHILYNQASGALFYDADGSGGAAKVQFATITNGAVLGADDFLIF